MERERGIIKIDKESQREIEGSIEKKDNKGGALEREREGLKRER